MRDGNNAENFRGTVADIGSITVEEQDELGNIIRKNYKTVKVEVSEDYLKDINKSILSDTGGKINLGNQIFYYNDWKFEYDNASGSYFYTFTIDENINNASLTENRRGKEAAIGQRTFQNHYCESEHGAEGLQGAGTSGVHLHDQRRRNFRGGYQPD